MLMFILIAVAAIVRLWPLVGAQPLCRVHKVRTGKVFNGGQQVPGDALYFPSTTTSLIKHPCKKTTALYLGRQVFFTRDNFENSLHPLTIPPSMMAGLPEVTSAHFAGARLLLVVNQKVYVYDYTTGAWNTSMGIQHPVSHVSGDNCCFVGSSFCLEISNSIFAYLHGEQIAQANIYFSNNGGSSFQKFTYEKQAELVGTLGGVFFLHSVSQVGLLAISNGKGMFAYSHHPLNRSLGLAFDYSETLEVLLPPGQRGLLILWSQRSLLSSLSAGQIMETIQVKKGDQTLHPSIFGANITIHSISAYENGLAVLTREDHLYYGSLGVLSGSSYIIKFPDQKVWSPEAALMFLNPGKLQILTPMPDASSPAYDFQQCVVNIQEILMEPELHIEKCKIELMDGFFEGKMYTMDMNSELDMMATLIPRPGMSLIPQVMVSNPYSLGLKTTIQEFDNTYEGGILYKLDIKLKQQHHWGWFDPNFTSSLQRPTISTLTVDIANKEMSCVDLKPLTALISIGCDQEKKIIVQNKISACSSGILSPAVLQDHYTYVIERESLDPGPGGQAATKDLQVLYPFRDLGCPGLVYYETPWKPVIELWRGDQFAELVEAEFVLREVHGLHTFSYALTAGAAGCRSQPQNWSSVLQNAPEPGHASWNRENYVSCHSHSSSSPLRWPDVQYQILGGQTDNKIIFKQRNGIYIFHLSILDPYYSYCHLETTFSIYVYGAYPLPLFRPLITIVLLVAGTLLAVWLAHILPKLVCASSGHKLKEAYRQLCWRCSRLCLCLRRPGKPP
ncbi:PREDICTED: cation channel sperm-associated protein subunit delta [Chinchilla lanigera]|uniref:cation channel sperm-associated protein subunit delta n=1 Tax=Chinchilla lanigera TaxID=34839 RepID=UPI000698C387|nr:PREDICTED: cation channel sperm-associated protein subunit delta [Chinchilla lanigera]